MDHQDWLCGLIIGMSLVSIVGTLLAPVQPRPTQLGTLLRPPSLDITLRILGPLDGDACQAQGDRAAADGDDASSIGSSAPASDDGSISLV